MPSAQPVPRNRTVLFAIVFLLMFGSPCMTASSQSSPPPKYSIVDLDTLGGGAVAVGINNLGQVVGNWWPAGDIGNNDSNFFLWDSLHGMVNVTNQYDYAYGINNLGTVAGVHSDGDGTAFIWDSTTGITDLGTLGGSRSNARAI